MLDQLFNTARTHNAWQDKSVSDQKLIDLYNLFKWGPTAANCSPARIVFVRTPEAKARLIPLMSPGNQEKTKQAPVTAIIGYDLEFYESLPKLFPHRPEVRNNYVGDDKAQFVYETAMRNSSLQGGYFILAARALGLDCGPMSGFDAQAVDAEFWAARPVHTNFICNLGYGDASGLFDRLPRLEFDEVCELV